jgi:hypothetical protein
VVLEWPTRAIPRPTMELRTALAALVEAHGDKLTELGLVPEWVWPSGRGRERV